MGWAVPDAFLRTIAYLLSELIGGGWILVQPGRGEAIRGAFRERPD
jgi:hypothetical protein